MMDRSSAPGRKVNRKRSRTPVSSASAFFEPLEARALLAAALFSPIADISVVTGAGPTTVSTIDTFRDSAISGTVVQFLFENVDPGVSAVNVEMFDLVTPQTVANFLSYVTAGRYDNTIIHRSMPNFVVQGGGFTDSLSSVSTFAPVQNEAAISNTRGTIAMAKTPGNPNSATSQWFFNVNNNGGVSPNGLDFQNGGFTVFGRVLGNGLTTIDKINDLPTFNAGGSFTDLPLSDYVVGSPLEPENLVTITDVSVRKPVVVTNAVSNNSDLVTVLIDETGNLKLDFAEGMTGTATITVTGTSANGTFASDTFNVTVEAGVAPVAGSGAFFAELNRAINITTKVFDLTSDTDGTIVRSSFQVVKLPTNGQLFFNASTEQIVYQPNPGFVGVDTFTYTVRDNHGFISNVGTITATTESVTTLSSEPGGINQLIYIDADGTRVDINLSGNGKVKLNFAGTPDTLRVTGNVGYMLGTNLSISNMQVSDTDAGSLLLISTRGGTDPSTAINTITVGSHMTGIWAPSVKLGAGGFTTNPGIEIGYVRLSDVANSSSITLGGTLGDSVVILRDVGASVNANFAASVAYLRARSWATGQINTTHVDTFLITGSTASGARLTTTLANRGVEWLSFAGGIAGTGGFSVASPISQVIVGANIASGATLNAMNSIQKLTVTGNMAANLQVAQSIITFKVFGDLASANILVGSAGSLLIGGKIQNSIITATSLINTVIAQSMVGSMIRVAPQDTIPPVPGGDQLPSSSEDFNTTGVGTLGYLFLTGASSTPAGAATFANSRVSAKSIRDARLGPVNTNNAGVGFGIAAMNYTGRLSVVSLNGNTRALVTDITSQADLDAQLSAQGFAKGNLILRVIE